MSRSTRRRLLRTAGIGGAGLVILSSSRAAFAAAANERINVALVGVGGRGEWFIDTIPRMQNVVAICDVNQRKLDGAFEYWQRFGRQYSPSQDGNS